MPYRALFEPYVAKYIGVDLPSNIEADLTVAPHWEMLLPGDGADVVLSTQVLEHVETPLAYLNDCYRMLKHGGLLILSTHGYWMYHPDPHDYWRWNHAASSTSNETFICSFLSIFYWTVGQDSLFC
jgi:SAM-dependent methyltransferase